MSKVIFGDVVRRANTKEDRHNTDKIYYVGGEHIESNEVLIENRGLIEGSTIGPMFYFGFKAGDILFVSRNPHLRKSGMVTFDGICSEKTFVLETKDESVLLQRYLAFVMQSDHFWSYMEAHKSGSVNFFINWSTLAKYEFELPDVDKQKSISDVLWAISDTQNAYKNLIKNTDALVQSRFIEITSNATSTIMLEDCATLHARVGWQALKKDEYQQTGDYMLITGTDFNNGSVDYSTCVYVSKERYDMDPNIQVQNGDILITKDGTIGKVAVVENLTMPATLNAGVFVVRPDGRFNVGYFAYQFKGPVFANFVEQVKSGSTIKHLNQGKLQKYPIPMIDANAQKQFADFYKDSEISKRELQQSMENLNGLKKSILSENFN